MLNTTAKSAEGRYAQIVAQFGADPQAWPGEVYFEVYADEELRGLASLGLSRQCPDC
jgi:hypothetical protein